MSSASLSFSICLEVVPELTRPWNPETAPQAMVTKSSGNHPFPDPSAVSATARNAGTSMGGCTIIRPTIKAPSPTMS